MYEFHEFPKWKYHAEKEALIVESREQEKALGEAWVDSPGLVVKKKAVETPAEAAIPDLVAQEIEELAEKVSALSRDTKRVRRIKS